MEFKFLVTNTSEGWRSWGKKNCEVDAAGVIIRKDPISTYVSPELILSLEGRGSGEADFSDMALDECGILYFLDSSRGEIYRYDPNKNTFEGLYCPTGTNEGERPLQFKNPQGIGVTSDSIYIVDTGNKRLHSISKHLLQTRWILEGDVFECPTDLVVDKWGNIYVLDAGNDYGEGAIVKVPKGGEQPAVIVNGLKMPLDIAIDDSQRLYVLERSDEGHSIWRFIPEKGGYTPEKWVTPDEFPVKNVTPSSVATTSGNELFIGEESEEGEKENEKSLLRYLPEEKAFARILSYRESTHKLVLDSRKNLYVITGDRKSVYFLKYARKNKFNDETSLYSGNVVKRFDSGKRDTHWHRIKLDFAFLGPGTQIQVSYFATNDDDLREGGVVWSPHLANPRDALFDGDTVKGRYLWIKIDLRGTEYDSPVVKSLRVYFPRMSYLRYLPTIYQEDESSREFLERFLSLFESFFVDVEEEIEGVTGYFDPWGVPAQYLSWLGSWLAIEADETWTESKKRELIARAPEFYKMRGTRDGLTEILKLYIGGQEVEGSDIGSAESPTPWCEAYRLETKTLDRLIEHGYLTKEDWKKELAEYGDLMTERMEDTQGLFGIFEYFQLTCIKDKELKEIYMKLFGCPHCFLVLVNPSSLGDEELKTVQRIVDSEAPAHTVGRVVGLQPWIYLDGHSYLGVNTILSKRRFVLEKSGLGKDSVLIEPEEYGHLELKSRVGVDTIIS